MILTYIIENYFPQYIFFISDFASEDDELMFEKYCGVTESWRRYASFSFNIVPSLCV